jgi:hypothetical protein
MIWVGPTKNQSHQQQKVRNISHCPHKEAKQQTPLAAAEIILPKASITMTNRKVDSLINRIKRKTVHLRPSTKLLAKMKLEEPWKFFLVHKTLRLEPHFQI